MPPPPPAAAPSPGPAAPRRRRGVLGASLAALFLIFTLGLPACVTLRPFAEVRREQPAARYVEVDGHAIYVEQQGSGDAVVLLHGFGASSYSWRLLMPELAKSFRVVAPDLYGFGWSERPRDAASYTREGQAHMVLGVLQALGIRRAQIVGHSYGGALTLFLAAQHPEIVRSIVLVDSAAPTYPRDRRTRLATLRPLDRLLLQLALREPNVQRGLRNSIHDQSRVTPELVRAYLDRLRVEGEVDAYYGLTARLPPLPASPPQDGEGHAAAASATPEGEVKLEALTMPALLVWGGEDHIVPPADGSKAARRLPQGEFVTLPDAGHMPMEDRPEELLRILVPFLAAHRGG